MLKKLMASEVAIGAVLLIDEEPWAIRSISTGRSAISLHLTRGGTRPVERHLNFTPRHTVLQLFSAEELAIVKDRGIDPWDGK